MELITGAELATRAGLSLATISRYSAAGKIPKQEDSNGRYRFEAETALEAVRALGIAPRKRAAAERDEAETPQEASQDASETETSEYLKPEAQVILKRALARSLRTFQKTVRPALEAAQQAGDEETEVTMLRLYVQAETVFDAVRDELIS